MADIISGSRLSKKDYQNINWRTGSNTRDFYTPGSYTINQKTGRYTSYGDIDWEKGTQYQKGGDYIKDAEYIVIGGKVIGKNPYYVDPASSAGNTSGTSGTPVKTDTIFNEKKDPETIDEALKTPKQQAEEQFRGQFLTNMEEAKKWGINLPYSTFEEFMDWRSKGNQSEMDYLTQQQGLSREMEASNIGRMKEGMSRAKAGTEAAMAQSREGVMSSTKPMIVSEFKFEMDRQSKMIELQREQAENERQQALTRLERAQEEGDIDLANAIQGQLSSIESNIKQIDTEALKVATLANEQALANFEATQTQSRANIKSFGDIVDSGIALDMDQIASFSTALNIPLETAYAYYKGADLIRKDKTLSIEEKQASIDKLKVDTLNVGVTNEMRNFQYYNSLSPELQSKYNSFKALGQTQLQKLDDGSIIAINPDTLETSIVYSPTIDGANATFNSIEGIQAGIVNGQLVVNSPANTIFSCGAGVNRTWGKASGEGGFGDSYQSKKDVVDSNGILKTSVTDPVNQIKPGMAFVMSTGDDVGHVGLVKSVNPDGTFNTIEWNANGAYKGSGSTTGPSNMTQGKRTVNEVYGFAFPPADAIDKAYLALDADQITRALNPHIGAKFKSEQVAKDVNSYVKANDLDGLKKYVMNVIYQDQTAEQKETALITTNIVDYGNQLKSKIADFEALGGDLGIFSGTLLKAKNKIGEIDDPKKQAIAQDMLQLVERFARVQTGAAITQDEEKRFEEILPSIYDSGELAVAKIDSFANYAKAKQKSDLMFYLPENVYESLYGGGQPAEQDLDPITQATNLWDKYTDPLNDIGSQFGLNTGIK